MKKILSLTLILAILAASVVFGSVSASAQKCDATVKVGSVTYAANIGDTFTYTVSVKSTKPLSTGQFELPVDFSVLSGETEADLNAKIDTVMPVAGSTGLVQRFDAASATGLKGYVLNFATEGSYDFTAKKVAFTLTFKVVKAGDVTMDTVLREFTAADGAELIDVNGNNNGGVTAETVVSLPLKTDELETPVLASVENVASGVTFKWIASDDAVKYAVYRKSGSGSWGKLGYSATTSYTDKTAKSGTTYRYTVRCADASGKNVSGYDASGLSIKYIAAPAVKTLTNKYGYVEVVINKSAGAAKYRVYRKLGSGKWTKVTDTTSLTVKDKKAAAGKKYSYGVRCLTKNAKQFTTPMGTTKSITYIAAPALVSAKKSGKAVKFTWKKSTGAVKYRVMRKVGKGKWAKLADTTKLNYTDKKVKKKTKYTYSVCCITNNGKKVVSGYNTTGKAITYK